MTNQPFLFTAGQRLRALRDLMGLKRPAFAKLTGIETKRLENIENGRQRMHDIDIEKVCSLYPQFTRWIAYGGPVDREALDVPLKVADSARMSAIYMVHRNPLLLAHSGETEEQWTARHQAQLQLLSESEERHRLQLEEAAQQQALEAEKQALEGGSSAADGEDEGEDGNDLPN